MFECNNARIDIKNLGDKDNKIEFMQISKSSLVQTPDWFSDEYGKGFVITDNSGRFSAQFKCINKGIIKIALRGIHKLNLNNETSPAWVCYTLLKINDHNILSGNEYVCHDFPFTYSFAIQDQEVINLEISWQTISSIKDLYRQNRAIDLNSISIREKILETKILSLETEMEFLKRKYIQSNREVDDIISKYQNNIWELKEIIRTVDNKQRSCYVKAYESILKSFGSWIGWTSIFDGIPCLPHGFFGIFISGGARIGKNAVIFQHVTIGSNTLEDSKNKGSPRIGDDCYIGAGAKIIGNVTIGNNCRIGANTVVVTDVPNDSVVVMNKPRIIRKENMDNKFYNFINGEKVYHLGNQFFKVKK